MALIEASRRGEMPAEVVLVLADVADAPVLEKARSAGVRAEHIPPGTARPVLAPEAEEEYVRRLREARVDLVCLAGFMRIIRRPLLEAFPGRILNIHPSLLPAFPGLSAQRQALDYGVKVSGATVHIVDAGTDTGPILVQQAVPVRETDTAEELAGRILQVEHQLYPRAVRIMAQGKIEREGRRARILSEPPCPARWPQEKG